MAKKVESYYCKDCSLNNNGWCPKLKRNGLKEITEAQCGGNKIPNTLEIIQPYDYDDILAKAANTVLGKPVEERKTEMLNLFKKSEEDNELIELLKENLRLDIERDSGLVPGSSKVTILLKFDDEVISDIDFGYSPSKGIYIE